MGWEREGKGAGRNASGAVQQREPAFTADRRLQATGNAIWLFGASDLAEGWSNIFVGVIEIAYLWMLKTAVTGLAAIDWYGWLSTTSRRSLWPTGVVVGQTTV